MPSQKENVIVLRVKLAESDTRRKLDQVALDIEATKKAQQDLTKARKDEKSTSY